MERRDYYEQVWHEMENHLSKKCKTKPNKLLINKSGPEYRAKVEEQNLLLSSLPNYIKFGARSWEMSLRELPSNNSENRTFVEAKAWPFSLFCQILNSSTQKQLETIRNPNDSNIIVSKLGIRNQDSEYVKKKYKPYLQQVVQYDPLPSIQTLQITTAKRPVPPQPQEQPIIEEATTSVDSTILQDVTSSFGIECVDMDSKFVFYTILNQKQSKMIKIKNVGTIVVQYEWKFANQTNQFSLQNQDRGKLLPEEEKQFIVCYVSSVEGIFTNELSCQFVPNQMAPLCIALRGVTTQG